MGSPNKNIYRFLSPSIRVKLLPLNSKRSRVCRSAINGPGDIDRGRLVIDCDVSSFGGVVTFIISYDKL